MDCLGNHRNTKNCLDEKCEKRSECITLTNELHGKCDCKYKKICHVSKQSLQVRNRELGEYKNVKDCYWYQGFKNKS